MKRGQLVNSNFDISRRSHQSLDHRGIDRPFIIPFVIRERSRGRDPACSPRGLVLGYSPQDRTEITNVVGMQLGDRVFQRRRVSSPRYSTATGRPITPFLGLTRAKQIGPKVAGDNRRQSTEAGTKGSRARPPRRRRHYPPRSPPPRPDSASRGGLTLASAPIARDSAAIARRALPVIGNSPVDLPRREIHTSLAREPTSYLGVCTLFMAIGEKGASRITYAAGYYAL